MAYQSVVNNSISKNNVKLSADKIIEKLDELREEGKKSKRRWIWELMQNAKDVPNIFDKVSIEITLNQNELIFAHNGNAFTIDNLTGLVQQVSSKHSTNQNKKVTGKFGTGFIATHLLSDIATIDGVLQEPGEVAKKFIFELDRSGKTSEDLMKPIEDALLELSAIDESPKFNSFPEYETSRIENNYFNTFKYPLDEDSIKTAEVGINDLIESLPISLVFLEDIKQVRIKNNVNNTQHLYKVEKHRIEEHEYNEVSISVLDEKNSALPIYKNFIVKSAEEIELLVEVKDFENYQLVSVNDSQPFLYRDFPLIGTEKFYFPFIVNGKTFNPTEKRDSLYLNGDSDKVTKNKQLLESAIDYSLDFVDYLVSKKATNLFSICLSNLPDYDFDLDDLEHNTKEWYIVNIQTKYRRQLINKKIVSHNGESCALSSVRFPTSNEYNYSELRNLITDFLGKTKVPVEQEQESWIHYLGPENEMHTWGLELSYGLKELVIDIDALETIDDFKAAADVYTWLNRLYKVIEDLKEQALHTIYKLVPNHKNVFKKLPALYAEKISDDDKANLPDPFLKLLSELGEDWYKDLIHRQVNILKEAHQSKSMSELNSAINSHFLKEDFIKSANSLTHLLNVHSIVAPSSKEDSFQRLLLDNASVLFKKEITLVSNEYASKYNFEIVHRLLIQSINNQLQKIGSITNLATELAKPKDIVTIWLSDYLSLLDGKKNKSTDYSKYLKEDKIIPNREEKNVFCYYTEILNYGTEEQPLDKDLLSILSKLNPQKNYFKELIADGIGIKVSDTLNFEKLGNEVVQEVEQIEYKKTFEENREALLELINWTEDEKELTKKYANKLTILSGRIFYILTIENSENREDVMKILRSTGNIRALAGIIDNTAFVNQIDRLVQLFPNGIPDIVMSYAKEDARKKKDFSNLLEVGSKVEQLFIKTLNSYQVTNEIIHAGGGAYDIRINNPHTEKSFYIELKSCRYQNTDPINIAISQAKRAVKELDNENFAIVIIERSRDNIMDDNFIKANTKYFKNPGNHLAMIGDNFDTIKNSSNTNNTVDLKMEFAEFKGTLDYTWVLNEIGNSGFKELLIDINKALT
jgi:DNA-dependent RNA polymerase auxiliary subunit epsilon